MDNTEALEEADSDKDVITSDQRFQFVGMDFIDAVEALRETHDELSPAAARLDDRVQMIADAFGSSKRTPADRKLLAPVFSSEIPEAGLSARDLIDRVWDAVGDTEWGPEFAYQLMKRTYRPRREPIFHSSILISVVAAFEHHLSKLAWQYYRAAPAALHDVPKEAVKEFSLRELQELNSVDDAIEHAIESRVEKLMYGSLAEWRKFFADRMKLDMAEMSASWSTVQEIFERRHCLVHNNGRASRRYAKAVKSASNGELLDVDLQYVRDATDALELLGVVLHASVWSKFAEDVENVADALERNAFQALKDKRWEFSLALYERWQILPLTAEQKLMAAVNVWIAKKGLHGLEAVRSEVADWDVSGSDELYRFAKHCLLEEISEAFEMVPMLIERDKIDGQVLATWPLMDVLRHDNRIQALDDIMREYLSDEADTTDLTVEDLRSEGSKGATPRGHRDESRESISRAPGEESGSFVEPVSGIDEGQATSVPAADTADDSRISG